MINEWEIGVSQFFIKNGINPMAAFDCEKEIFLTPDKKNATGNKTFENCEELLKEGYPFLKKKYKIKQNIYQRIFSPKDAREDIIRLYSFDSEHAHKLVQSIKN